MDDLSTDLTVLRGLATNPAAPLSVLLRLAVHARHGSRDLAHALLDREDVPAPVVRELARYPDVQVRRRVAAHPSTPDDVRRALAADAEPIVRAEVAAWPGSWIDRWSLRPVAATSLPAEVYRSLAADPVPAVRAEVGRNRYVPQDVRAALAEDPDREVRRCVALRALPPAALHRLLGDADRAVRQTALMTAATQTPRGTIPAELVAFFHDDSAYHRQAAVELVELTPPLFEQLSAQPELREALARNPGTPAAQLRAFMQQPELCAAVAGNPGLPESLLDDLVATGDPEVHRELLHRADLPDRLRRQLIAASEDDEPLPLATSLLPEHASLEVRLSYLDHPNVALRRTLAFSGDLPSAAVRRLAKDPDFLTRVLVCERHTDVPPETLVEVAERWGGHTREDLLRHPRLPAAALPGHAASDSERDRAAIASRPDLPPALVRQLLADPTPHVRRTAAANPCLSDGLLRQLLTDSDPLLREGAASNPTLGVEDMERLLAE